MFNITCGDCSKIASVCDIGFCLVQRNVSDAVARRVVDIYKGIWVSRDQDAQPLSAEMALVQASSVLGAGERSISPATGIVCSSHVCEDGTGKEGIKIEMNETDAESRFRPTTFEPSFSPTAAGYRVRPVQQVQHEFRSCTTCSAVVLSLVP